MDSSRKQLAALIARLAPERAKEFRAARKKMRALFPSATEIVYDYPNSIVIAYGPGEKGYEGIFSLAVRADGVSLYFTQGPKLPDPTARLQGTGKVVRYVQLETTRTIDEPDVRRLMDAALKLANVRFDPKAAHRLVIKPSKTKAKPKTKARTKAGRAT